MYEENLEALPAGNATQAFGPVFEEMKRNCALVPPAPLTHEEVLFWADSGVQEYLRGISRRLLLPGSGIQGIGNLQKLVELADRGASCVVCLNHRSNLDVPTLCALLHDLSRPDLFDRIIWIAGRKLHEDRGLTGILVQAFNRVMVTPRSWLGEPHSEDELQEGHRINFAALRTIHELRHQGRVFALFPTGTRIRPDEVGTMRAIPETDSYLKSFEYLLPGHIAGCTLPVSRGQDMTRETPRVDRVRINFGSVVATQKWRSRAAGQFPDLSQRGASARAIMDDIAALGAAPERPQADASSTR